jgi:hypothetical protein
VPVTDDQLKALIVQAQLVVRQAQLLLEQNQAEAQQSQTGDYPSPRTLTRQR